MLVLITKVKQQLITAAPEFYHYTYRQFHCINVRRIENCIFCVTFLLQFSILEKEIKYHSEMIATIQTCWFLFNIGHQAVPSWVYCTCHIDGGIHVFSFLALWTDKIEKYKNRRQKLSFVKIESICRPEL